MATHNILEGINWIITQPTEDTEYNNKPIEEDTWQRIILSKNNFIIQYPISEYGEETIDVLHETDGQPVTLLDLLTTIHEFYTEDLSDEIREQILAIGPHVLLTEHLYIVLGMRNILSGLVHIGPNKYLLKFTI